MKAVELSIAMTLAAAVLVALHPYKASASSQLPALSGRTLFTSAAEVFQLRAFSYSPTPIGACLPSSSTIDERFIRRDAPMMVAAGANAIRIYGGLRIARNGQFDFGVSSAFFQEAASNGLWVIVGTYVPPDMDFGNPATRALLVRAHTNLVSRFKNESNILMWALGNEVDQWLANTNQLKNWYSVVDEIAHAIRQEQGGGTGPSYGPYVTCVNGAFNSSIENKPLVPTDDIATNIDLWGVNIYSGPTLGGLFIQVAQNTTKPFWIAEMGIDSYDNASRIEDQTSQAKYVEALWEQVLAHRKLVIGGVLAFYSDEWWKDPAGQCAVHNTGGGAYGNGPDNFINEEWLGVASVSVIPGGIDAILPKKAFYEIERLWLGDCPCFGFTNAAPFLSSYNAIDRSTNAFNNYAGYQYAFHSGNGSPVIRCDVKGASLNPGDRALHVRLTQPAGSTFGFFGIAETLFPDELNALSGVSGVDLRPFDTISFDAWLGTAGATNRWRIRLEDSDFVNEWQNVNLNLMPLTTNIQSFVIPVRNFVSSGAKRVDLSRVVQIVFQPNVPESVTLSSSLLIDLVVDNLRIYSSATTNESFMARIARRVVVEDRVETTIAFPVDPRADHIVQCWNGISAAAWTNLPGGPHNRGCANDESSHQSRYYRVLRQPK